MTPPGSERLLVKRIVDVVVAGVVGIATLPIMVACALVLALQLRANPFFHQTRIGRHGRPLMFPKLRTLDPRSTPKYALKNRVDASGATRFARLVRRSKIDELPQLFLVVAGRLSLVGPRPRMPDEWEPVADAYQAMRENVPQGCTGMWQISRHAHAIPSAHPEYDAFYVDYRSMRLDLWILWRTVRIAAGGERIGLDDVPASLIRPRATRTLRPWHQEIGSRIHP